MKPDYLPTPPDEMEERQAYAAIDAADKAKRILDDPLVETYFDNIKRDCFDRWCKTIEPKDRDEIWRLMWAVEKLRAEFKTTINEGIAAQQKVSVWQRIFRRTG